MADPLEIACLQTCPMATMPEAIAHAISLAEEAVETGAEILFLPEYCGGLVAKEGRFCPPCAPEAQHPFLAAMRQFAKQHHVWVQIGSIAVNAGNGRFANRGYMISNNGQIIGSYDKIHLFDIALDRDTYFRESDTVRPGRAARIYHTPWAKIGHAICYDLRFAALFRALAQEGAAILTCPSAFTQITGAAHWHVLNRARAIENTRFMISACSIGPVPGGGACYGHSLVVDPWGHILADGGDQIGVLRACIDLDAVPATAKRIPSLCHDRSFHPPRQIKAETPCPV